jgi:hypothetical protein
MENFGENSSWNLTVVSEHVPLQLWALRELIMRFMRPKDEQNITYRRRRGRTPDPPGWEEEEVVREEET